MQMYANYLRSRRAARRQHQPPETMRRSSPAVKLEQFHVYYVLDGSKDFQRVVKESAPRHKYLINTRDGRLIGGARQSLYLSYILTDAHTVPIIDLSHQHFPLALWRLICLAFRFHCRCAPIKQRKTSNATAKRGTEARERLCSSEQLLSYSHFSATLISK